MTDLERAREVEVSLRGEPMHERWEILQAALAAARREGAEAALAELNEALSNGDPEAWRKVDVGIPKTVAAAERRGAEEMRERAAAALDEDAPWASRAIRALPLEAKE